MGPLDTKIKPIHGSQDQCVDYRSNEYIIIILNSHKLINYGHVNA